MNNTTLTLATEVEYRTTTEIAIAAVFLILLLLITVIGNVTVVIAARTYHKLKEQHSTMFIVNLALTDLLVALLVMICSLLTLTFDLKSADDDNFFLGWVVCSIQCAMNYCLIVVSMMTLGFVSVDRFIHIIYPLQYTDIMTVCRIRILILYTWVQGFVIGFTPVATGWIHYDYHEVVCAINWSNEGADIYVIVAFITCFVAPGATMIVCYSVILKRSHIFSREIRRSMNRVNQPNPNSPSTPTRKSVLFIRQSSSPKGTGSTRSNQKLRTSANHHKRIIKSLLIVVAIFFICMTPFCVTKLIKVLGGDVAGWVNTLATYVQLAASASNPFIYGIFRVEFRKAFKAQYRKLTSKSQCEHKWIPKKEQSSPEVTALTFNNYKNRRHSSTASKHAFTAQTIPERKPVNGHAPPTILPDTVFGD